MNIMNFTSKNHIILQICSKKGVLIRGLSHIFIYAPGRKLGTIQYPSNAGF